MNWLALVIAATPIALPTGSMSLAEVQQGWSGGRLVSVNAPQGFSEGLLQSGLLEALNRYRWAPRTADRRFDADAFEKLWVGPQWVMAFDQKGQLRFAFFRFSVPVDPRRDPTGGWSADRMWRKNEIVAQLRAQLSLQTMRRDKYGNVFQWQGRSGRRQARLRYEPAVDELRLLLRF